MSGLQIIHQCKPTRQPRYMCLNNSYPQLREPLEYAPDGQIHQTKHSLDNMATQTIHCIKLVSIDAYDVCYGSSPPVKTGNHVQILKGGPDGIERLVVPIQLWDGSWI